jgi:hypothetical protein
VGKSWGDGTYGSGYLTQRVSGLLSTNLESSSARLWSLPRSRHWAGQPEWKANNDDADARIKEFNAILEAAVRARQVKGFRVETVDNYALGNRAYGNGPEFTWGSEEQQSGDWVHPRPDASAWKGMATNFAAGLNQLLKNDK